MSASGFATAHFTPMQRGKLTRAGFITLKDITELKPLELVEELEISPKEAIEVLEIARECCCPTNSSNSSSNGSSDNNTGKRAASSDPHGSSKRHQQSTKTMRQTHEPITALSLLLKERSNPPIITFCNELDNMIGGGIPLTKVTEFCGPPGIGKTQVGIQLAINVQIPKSLNGVEGEAVYIDTEGSFVPERAMDMAEAAMQHLQFIQNEGLGTNQGKIPTALQLLAGIHYFRVHSYLEQLAVIHILPEFLSKHPRVKLVVIDSVAFHFRRDFKDMILRTRLLNGMAQSLLQLARDNNLAVVLMNQMTTKVSRGVSKLVPALGESWGHASTIRIILYWENSVRNALLYKSPSEKEQTVVYAVQTEGIRSVGNNYANQIDRQNINNEEGSRSHLKRQHNDNDNDDDDDDDDNDHHDD